MCQNMAQCEACDAEIDPSIHKCPECGNNPIRDGILQILLWGLALGFGSIFWWPIAVVGAFLLFSAVLLFVLHKTGLTFWGDYYSPAKRDFPSP